MRLAGTAGLLVLASAATCLSAENPLVVLREASRREAPEVLDAAAAAPDEATAILQRGSPALARILESSSDDALRQLNVWARERCVPESVCPAAAVFYRQVHAGVFTREQAKAIAASRARYFHELVSLRLEGEDALFDRVLHRESETIRSAWMDGGEGRASLGLGGFPARDLLALLCYGQREESEVSFSKLFDAEFASRMSGGRLMEGIHAMHSLRLRHFLVEAIRADRVLPLLAVAGAQEGDLLAEAVRGVAAYADPEMEATSSAEVIEAYAPHAPVQKLQAQLLIEAEKKPALAGLLAAWLERVRPSNGKAAFEALASRYRASLPDSTELGAADLCAGKLCVQRLIFFDDDDGVVSFGTFRAAYQKDPRWSWEDHPGYARVWRKGESGLTIEIFANRPLSGGGAVSMSWMDAEARSEANMVRAMQSHGAPRIFVQRGHAYHVGKAISVVPPEARLVYLGGCRGTENLSAVLDRAARAQIIATRSTGTMDVNDPLLKAINDELADRGAIDWPAFWSAQRARFAGSHLFARYIPPHRNGAVIFMQAWRRVSAKPQVGR